MYYIRLAAVFVYAVDCHAISAPLLRCGEWKALLVNKGNSQTRRIDISNEDGGSGKSGTQE